MLTGPELPAEFLALGDLMRREWLSFASCGNPGWSPYGTEHRTTRVYDLQPDTRSYPEEASMHLWERHMFDALGCARAGRPSRAAPHLRGQSSSRTAAATPAGTLRTAW